MTIKTNTLQLLAALAPLASGASVKRDMPRTKFGSVPYGLQIRDCTVPGKIALTFDDGPSMYTENIISILERNGAKGTFYMVGSNGESGLENTQFHPLVKKMVASGHQVAHHSWSHPYFTQIGRAGIIEEMTKLESVFVQILGFTPTYFRPPYTDCGDECYSTLGELGYHVTDYNLDTQDWQADYPHRAAFVAAIAASNPAVDSQLVLSHDIQERTGATDFVQFMIDTARAQGYTSFVTVGECLGDPSSNWYRDPTTGGPVNQQPPPPPPTTTPPTTTPRPTTTKPTDSPTDKPTDKPTSKPTDKPTSKPTDGWTVTTITMSGTTYTTVCPETTVKPTGCKGRLCTATGGDSLPSHTTVSHTHTTATPTRPGGTGTGTVPTGKPSQPTTPGVPQVNGAVARGAGVNIVVASLFGAAAWMLL